MRDGREQLKGVCGVLLHDRPFVIRERTRLQQDAVGNPHLAHVVQQRAAAQVCHLFLPQPHGARQAHGQVGDPLGMSLGFLVAEVERSGPPFQRRVISEREVNVCPLQPLEQFRVVDGNGGLPGQRLQKLEPLRRRLEWAALEDLQHADDLPFGDQRRHERGHKSFLFNQVPAGKIRRGAKIVDANRPPIEHGPPGISFPEAQPVRDDGVPAKSSPGTVKQFLGMGVDQQHICRVRVEFADDLVQDDSER